jgi:hypothetical protein
MENESNTQQTLGTVPACVTEYVNLVAKKMRYRKKVCMDVRAEFAAHFQDELRDCTTNQRRQKRAQQLIADFGDVKLLAVLLRRAKKRCRPLWRTVLARTCQTAAIITVCFVLYVIWFFSGKPNITTDYVAQLNRIAKPVADESLNAAPFYEKALELYVKEPNELYKFSDWPAGLTDEQTSAVTRWIKANEACFEQVKLASERTHYWQRYEGKPGDMVLGLSFNLPEFRKLARLVLWRAKMKAYQGRTKDAFGDILLCYRMGMHPKVPTTLIEQLVGMNVEAMAVDTALMVLDRVDVGEDVLSDFQRRFERLVEQDNFRMRLDGEKLSIYDEVQRLFTDGFGGGHIIPRRAKQLHFELHALVMGLSANTGSAPPPQKQRPSWLEKRISDIRYAAWSTIEFARRLAIRARRTAYLLFLHPDKQETFDATQQLYNYWEGLTVKSPAQIRTERIDPEKQTEQIIKGNMLLEMFGPALVGVSEIAHQRKAEIQALVSILALMRYKCHKGLYPEDLEELITASYLKKLPVDPYSDKPLIYKKRDKDFVLYSIGRNFADDGAEVVRRQDGRIRKWAFDGDTVFWPLPEAQVEQ